MGKAQYRLVHNGVAPTPASGAARQFTAKVIVVAPRRKL